MLLRLEVSNHLSILDPQELSFRASSLKDWPEGLIDCAAVNGSILPAVVIYGANASGKSNFVAAMQAMRSRILWSHTSSEPDGGVPHHPFRLDAAAAQMPSCFNVDFVIGGVRHHYGFESSDTAFVSEWLYVFPRSHRRTLFERDGNEFRFGRTLRGPNKIIASLSRPNSLFLSAAAQNDHEQLSSVFGYFRSIQIDQNIAVPGARASAELAEQEIDDRVINFLKKVGTGIVGYQRKETEISEKERMFNREIFAFVRKLADMSPDSEVDIDRKISIEFAHRGRDGKQIYFELDRESAGTRRLLIVLTLAFRALDKGLPLFIDELDASLHTHASEAVLRLFCSRKNNPKGAQLIVTTHDTNLMNSPALRRDQLWFIQKDAEGTTQLYPLTDIRTRMGDNIEKGYLQGRYGAVPFDDPIFDREA